MRSESQPLDKSPPDSIPDFKGRVCFGDAGDVAKKNIAVIVSEYHREITSRLLEGALRTLDEAKIPQRRLSIVWVPGTWEIAVAAKRIISSVDAVICLGCVVRGETTHDQYINSMISQSLGCLSIESGKPVSFGVLTCNTIEQAHQRSGGVVGNKGREAAESAVKMLRLFDQLG
jgi:6,7-dimethyl-8-ribityllumazine synthase